MPSSLQHRKQGGQHSSLECCEHAVPCTAHWGAHTHSMQLLLEQSTAMLTTAPLLPRDIWVYV
jgi:hypothetical protein